MNLLYDYYSIPKCLVSTDRHLRLCRQVPGAEKYLTNILPSYNQLDSKYKLADDALKNRYAAHDSVTLCDYRLDSVMIELHHDSSDYDRAHVGSFTLNTLFPDGNYSPITNMNMYHEVSKATEIAHKVESLGETHALFPFAAKIKAAVTASNTAITAEEDAVKAEGLAKADADIAKLQLIRKYNSNYYQAADDGGKKFAEQLFPVLSSGPKDDEEDKK